MTNKPRSFEDVARDCELPPNISRRYIHYMRARWVDKENMMCATGYADKWAMKFKTGREYASSDYEGRLILSRIPV